MSAPPFIRNFVLTLLCIVAGIISVVSSSAFAQSVVGAADKTASKAWVEPASKPAPVVGQKRLALILGNTNYGGDRSLKNPENDAKGIAAALGELGFTSTVVLDGSLEQMSDAVHAFADRVRASGSQSVALIYYSGHGIQVNGDNYLLPVGFVMPVNERDINRYALSAESALTEMQEANAQVNIAILDACRNNPFAKSRDFGGKGLAKLEATGVFIAYSTAAGTTADDNIDGKNGLYTASLLTYLRQPGLTLTSVFTKTRNAVAKASNRKQVPFVTDGLIDAEDFCLLPGVVSVGVEAVGATAPKGFTPPLTLAEYKAQMVTVPAGKFKMGLRDGTHVVDLSAYKIGKTAVTVGMWQEYCTATKRQMPEEPSFNIGWAKRDHPIVNVTWEDAQKYCLWAGLGLPSEAQWEKAARGADARRFPWGNEFDPKKLWCSTKGYADAGGTRTVGDFPSGASPYGCLDMAGNVRQWCVDIYDENLYRGFKGALKDPVKLSGGKERVIRGSAWDDYGTFAFRSEVRFSSEPTVRHNSYGFRAYSAIP